MFSLNVFINIFFYVSVAKLQEYTARSPQSVGLMKIGIGFRKHRYLPELKNVPYNKVNFRQLLKVIMKSYPIYVLMLSIIIIVNSFIDKIKW